MHPASQCYILIDMIRGEFTTLMTFYQNTACLL
jgi:hypothetical protein